MRGTSIRIPGQPKGDWIFRLGWSDVNPADQNVKLPSDLYSPTLDEVLPVGGYIVADQGTSLSGTVTYMITDHIGTELLVAWPFTHGLDVKSSNSALNGRIGYVTQLPPTLSLQWHFNPEGVVRPYVGVGMNWTMFSDETLKKGFKNTLDSLGYSNAKLSMDDSFGGAAPGRRRLPAERALAVERGRPLHRH